MGTLANPAGVEDIHSRDEQPLAERLGAVGKKLHAGRSLGNLRNDSNASQLTALLQTFAEPVLDLNWGNKP